ncbi:RNA polymerase sigma factor SigF [Streptantibioticus cattleyicolor]|uniref:RNA polymerase, sigma 28 subunit, Sig B/F/G subfamily n=1 Tax=Streptantibioticus cattleyicolor (strain ATCC 35852 / DSM 46488 / JCM 4925 / NBRC 14057 / NRRL 8057) TaxID=1003195 RepID=F8JN62_STREN|nr:RNA polymerase sigma factor SigF [Streptantibioticus cattleyicolor]AEW99188.1 RNA polymerase, sigma 28 subunit, Sig B/F/G subfamily [Streptantibioticus cattleyicolor NRRL 8057 = DSM 46488]CCB71770.1 RNA polymerase sigma-F factor [Streptantibioticus cattleyicolor NRRL 8057 = DSM 46488]
MSVQLTEEVTTPVGGDEADDAGLEAAGKQGFDERLDAALLDGAASAAEVRQISKVMFARLAVLEEGTEEYQYVRNTLIELNMALVRFAAKRFGNRAEQMEDILQVGTIGLIKAVDRFDPDYGVEFVTFALPTIIGEMKRFFRDTSWSVRVPRRLQELRIDLAKATDALAAELDRAPTTAELAARLDIGEEEVVEAQVAANAYTASSIDAQAGDDEDDGTAWADRLGAEDPALEGVENLTALAPLVAELPERERAILAMRFSADMTQKQIGERLGISQMHISRLLSRTLGKLREGLLAES